MFAVSLDGRYIYACGCWDNSLKVISVNRGKTVASVTRHLDIITCIALDNCGSYLVTGSKDCTCIVWMLTSVDGTQTSSAASSQPTTPNHINQAIGNSQTNTHNNLTPRPLNTLYGHDKAVSCVAIFTELDMVVSGSEVSIYVHFNQDPIAKNIFFEKKLMIFLHYCIGWNSECAYYKRWTICTNT